MFAWVQWLFSNVVGKGDTTGSKQKVTSWSLQVQCHQFTPQSCQVCLLGNDFPESVGDVNVNTYIGIVCSVTFIIEINNLVASDGGKL